MVTYEISGAERGTAIILTAHIEGLSIVRTCMMDSKSIRGLYWTVELDGEPYVQDEKTPSWHSLPLDVLEEWAETLGMDPLRGAVWASTVREEIVPVFDSLLAFSIPRDASGAHVAWLWKCQNREVFLRNRYAVRP